MSADELRASAELFLRTALRHEECLGGKVVTVEQGAAYVELELNVEMPRHFMIKKVSPNGVRTSEPVTVKLLPDFPWEPPVFYLRQDFPRDLPHLQPGPATALPRPCLVDGNSREYFLQFGLLELGVFNLLHQLVLWLQRAAEGTLIHHGRGWEPALRRDLNDAIVIDAEACRAMVDRSGGYRVLKADFFRSGDMTMALGAGAKVWLNVTQIQVPLKHDDKDQFTHARRENAGKGNTVCAVIWPDKLPNGTAFVADKYLPETVGTLHDLEKRVDELRCRRAVDLFVANLERVYDGFVFEPPVPVGIILCARRPCHLVDSASDIELLPYIIEMRPVKGRKSIMAAGKNEPVMPARQMDTVNATLLRNVSGAPQIAPVALIGCGSVGSKMALHLTRSGVQILVVSDMGILSPHHMARHALVRSSPIEGKAEELAKELGLLAQSPAVNKDDLVESLRLRDKRSEILPKQAGYAINSTASLGVRETLSGLAAKDLKLRLVEVALFGRGEGGFLLAEGSAHNPTLCDLIDELNATAPAGRLHDLLYDPEHGLSQIQIGQGCGTMTMPMTDMRLSAMTAPLAEEFMSFAQNPEETGRIVVGVKESDSSNTVWTHQTVAPFSLVDIEGPEGWTLRASQRVLDMMAAEVNRYPGVETGGVMIGSCSARLRTVTVVDLIEAPVDSTRSATLFVLGTGGLKKAIRDRHAASGKTLFDVGTWHSHLSDHGPSSTDRATAKALALERPPPSVLLIVAPTQRYALMHAEVRS